MAAEVVIGAGAAIGVEAAVTEAVAATGVVAEEEEALIAETTAEAAAGEATIVEEENAAVIVVASAASGEMVREAAVEVGAGGVMSLLVFPGPLGKSLSSTSLSTFA